MNTSHKLAGLVFVMLFLISLTPATGQVEFTADEAQFIADNPNLANQNFLSTFVAPGDNNLCISPVNSQSDDNCFSPGDILPEIEITGTLLRLLGANIAGNGNPTNALIISENGLVFDIFFDPGVTAAGIRPGCISFPGPCNENARIQVFGESGLLDEIVLPISGTFNDFLGITSSVPIVNIRLQDSVPNEPTDLGVLYVRFQAEPNPIPTLSEWGMIAAAGGLMLAGVYFAVRRRRASINL